MTSATPPRVISHLNTPYLHLPNPHNGILFFPRDEYLNTLYRYEILWGVKFTNSANLHLDPEYLQSLWTNHILQGVVPLQNYNQFLLQHLDTKYIYKNPQTPPGWQERHPGIHAERMTAADLNILCLAHCK